ncbi:hypothetical protein M758_9G024300, partial [Ceratodon purpureus]
LPPILKAAHSLPTLAHKEISPELPVRAAEHRGIPGRPKTTCMRPPKKSVSKYAFPKLREWTWTYQNDLLAQMHQKLSKTVQFSLTEETSSFANSQLPFASSDGSSILAVVCDVVARRSYLVVASTITTPVVLSCQSVEECLRIVHTKRFTSAMTIFGIQQRHGSFASVSRVISDGH